MVQDKFLAVKEKAKAVPARQDANLQLCRRATPMVQGKSANAPKQLKEEAATAKRRRAQAARALVRAKAAVVLAAHVQAAPIQGVGLSAHQVHAQVAQVPRARKARVLAAQVPHGQRVHVLATQVRRVHQAAAQVRQDRLAKPSVRHKALRANRADAAKRTFLLASSWLWWL